MSIILQADGAWPDLRERKAPDFVWESNAKLAIARISNGMASGASSVAIRIDLADGRTIVAETSMILFCAAADGFRAADAADAERNAGPAPNTPPPTGPTS